MQAMKLDIKKAQPIYKQIRGEIMRMLREGKLSPGSKLPTEHKIAEQFGISRGTVRQALSKLTQEGIVERFPKRGTFISIDHLQVIMRIGVISPILKLKGGIHKDPFCIEMLSGLYEGMMRSGGMVVPIQEKDNPDAVIKECEKRKVDGLIFLLPVSKDKELVAQLNQKLNIPFICIGSDIDDNVNFITGDDRYGSKLAVEHLLELGHSRIGGIFVNCGEPASAKRYEGFKSTLKTHGISIDNSMLKIVQRDAKGICFQESLQATRELLDSTPNLSAIYAGGVEPLLAASQIVKQAGLKIPKDISLIGYDDFFMAGFSDPSFSVISQPVWEMGSRGVDILMKLIMNKKLDQNKAIQEKLIPELIIRNSTCSQAII